MKALPVLLSLALCFSFLAPRRAQADPMREFLISSAYGVLAGSLVGAATLALSEDPDSNYNNIAKGASLGLYGGMLLGGYLVFMVPEPSSRRASYPGALDEKEETLGSVALLPQWRQGYRQSLSLDGFMVQWRVTSF